MKTAVSALQSQYAAQTRRPAFFFGLILGATVAVLVQSCTPAAANEPETIAETYPADWTANPTAGVVYEPIDESGVSHD